MALGVAVQAGLRGLLELQVKLSLTRPRRWRLQLVMLGFRLGLDHHARKACKGRVAWHLYLGRWSLAFCPRAPALQGAPRVRGHDG